MSLKPLGAVAGATAVGALAVVTVAGPGADEADAGGAGEGKARYASADAQVNPWGLSAQRESVDLAASEVRFGSIEVPRQVATRTDGVVTGWIPFWNYEPGLESFRANADLFSEVYGFFHEVDSSGEVHTYASPSQIVRLKEVAREAGVPLYGTILDAGDPHAMAKIIADDKKRQRHIREILRVVDENGYDGIDIDYEQFAFADGKDTWARTRPNWVRFMKELSQELHRRGKLLSTATPTIYDGERSDSSGYWVYDWEGIAPYVDKLGVMTYDFSYEKAGPTSPRGWFQRTTDYAVSVLGDKANMGVPAFGYDWSKCSSRSSMTQTQALRKARKNGIKFDRDNWAGEARFVYGSGKCKHTVWFGDPMMFGERTAATVNSGGGAIAMWALGNEGPWTWEEIRKAVGQQP